MPHVTVFVLNFNGMKYADECITSLLGTKTDANLEIVVIDNKSTDGSLEHLLNNYRSNPRIRIVPLDQNYGFGPSFMQALERIPVESRFLAFSSIDITVDPSWLDEPLTIFEKNHNVGAVGFIMCNAGNPIVAEGAGGYLMSKVVLTLTTSHVSSQEYRKFLEWHPRPYPVFSPSGGIFIVKSDVFQRIGGFDQEFFLYGEEFDIGMRMWLLGYKIFVAPHSKVHHYGAYSTSHIPTRVRRRFSIFLAHKNAIRTLIKCLPSETLALALLPSYTFLLLQAFAEAVVLKDIRVLQMHFRAVIWNVRILKDTLRLRREFVSHEPVALRLDEVVRPKLITVFFRGVLQSIKQS